MCLFTIAGSKTPWWTDAIAQYLPQQWYVESYVIVQTRAGSKIVCFLSDICNLNLHVHPPLLYSSYCNKRGNVQVGK